MTLDEWWEQATDRERDHLVNEKVMGGRKSGYGFGGVRDHVVPEYTTSIDHAWEVVEELEARDIHTTIEVGYGMVAVYAFDEQQAEITEAEAETAPEAISLAAVKALDVEAPE